MKFATVAALGSIIAASTTTVLAQTTTCADQSVFNLCLQNQDTYLKTCATDNYQCLCHWNQAKLSCYTSCPNDPTYGTQVNVVASYCSIPGANVTSTWTGSTATATATASASANASASSSSKPSSAGTQSKNLAWGVVAAGVSMAVAVMLQ
ncbi:hypothetical protein BC940DRAFT_305095 [Gongronella butleri]|nr:hypothetical protein BC940DRAFT_305095 [Gongronella butleri]